MTKLYSYVVDHDYGFAPCPFYGVCTLAKCKFGTKKKRNIVELANVGDWIVGTGGANLRKSAGHGRLIYAMRVDDKESLAYYCRRANRHRIDAQRDGVVRKGRFALISRHFFYFGRNAIDIPSRFRKRGFEKRGPGHRSDFDEKLVEQFTKWLSRTFKSGAHGQPCKLHSGLQIPKCTSLVRRRARK